MKTLRFFAITGLVIAFLPLVVISFLRLFPSADIMEISFYALPLFVLGLLISAISGICLAARKRKIHRTESNATV